MKLFAEILVGLTGLLFSQLVVAIDATAVSSVAQPSKLTANKAPNQIAAEMPSWTSSLCNEQETVIFSCSIDQSPKTVSLCYLPSRSQDVKPTMQYRFGKKGETPELIYPKQPTSIEQDFSFSSHKNSTGFPLETISFSRGTVIYEVTTADKSEYVRWAPFAGVEVTLSGKPTRLIDCARNSVQVELSPIKKLLHIKDDGQFSDVLKKANVDDSAFPVTHNVTTDSVGAETTVSYPAINDSNIDKEILKFVGDCDWEDYSHTKGSKCSNTVSASIIKDEYLVIHFDGYMYAAGTPHGYGNQHTKIYRKIDQIWQPIKGSDFFVDSDYCHENINSMLYRQLKPLKLSSLETNQDSDQEPLDLMEEADIYPTAQGIEFAYQQYQLGSYAQTPWPVLVPWNNLSKCLRSQ